MITTVELFSLLGFPARVAGRALLASRYISSKASGIRVTSSYGERRFGRSVKWRPWLMIDMTELEAMEDLINQGSDAQVEAWRVSQLSVCGMIAIIGALVAQAGLTALQLPALEETHFIARGAFIMSLMLAFISVFFSGLQQSSFGRAAEPRDLRVWLSSGARWNEEKKRSELQSSMVAHMILQAPFEIVVMSITLFIVGFGVYLGSSWADDVKLNIGYEGNRAVLIAFIIPTVFALVMYGHMMGLKDRELVKGNKRISTDLKFDEESRNDVEVAFEAGFADLGSMRKTTVVKESMQGLTFALKEAAEAHRKCAKADEEVAKMYELLLKVQ